MDGFMITEGVLEQYTGVGGDVVIPDGVTEIGESAFARCDGLKSVTIPRGVRYIGDSAFANYGNLVIHAPAGSYAAQYAEENWLNWVEEDA